MNNEPPRPTTKRLFNPARLAAGLALLAALFAPLYLFVLERETDPDIRRALLLAAPAGSDAARVGLDEGKLAPDFEISMPAGQRLRLSELRGRPVVINFWATWCASCLTEMPELKQLQADIGLDAFTVLAVNAGETSARAREFIDFLEAPFLYGLDPGLVISDAYGVHGLPLSVFLDSEGVVRGVYRGHANRAVLETFVNAAIEARPPGEIPVILRTVSIIPRERLLHVERLAADELRFTSRSLRCDSGYCAEAALTAALAALPGVRDFDFASPNGGEPVLTVRFDPAQVPEEDVVSALTRLLEDLPDPVYDRAIEVNYEPAG